MSKSNSESSLGFNRRQALLSATAGVAALAEQRPVRTSELSRRRGRAAARRDRPLRRRNTGRCAAISRTAC